MAQKHNLQMSHKNREKILKIFALINEVLPQVNNDRERVISIKFILRQIVRILGREYKCIPLSKSKKTLTMYDKYWNELIAQIGDEINKIIK